MSKPWKVLWLATGAAAAMAAAAPAASAQTEGDGTEIAEVVVTSQRREERLQDVPLAVTAATAERLSQAGIATVQDLRYIAPSLTFQDSNGPRGEGLFIRGIGTQSFSDGVEQSVGIVVDGVVMGATGIGNNALGDVARVEVLRGPQGTLFGKNASAGVVSIVTAAPVLGTWKTSAKLRLGEHQDRDLSGMINAPLGPDAALRLSVYEKHRGGFTTNLVSGEDDLNARYEWGARAKLLWRPTDALDLTLAVDWAERDQDCCRDMPRDIGAPNNALIPFWSAYGLVPSIDNRNVTLDGPGPYNCVQDRGVALTANYQWGEHTLTSITAFRKWDQKNHGDSDAIAAPIGNVNEAVADQKQFTQELRLTSPSGQRLEYVLGLFFFDSRFRDYNAQAGYLSVAGLAGLNQGLPYFERAYRDVVDNKSYAAYGQATYRLTEDLRLILGARYTRDEIDLEYHAFLTNNRRPWPGQTFPQDFTASHSADNVSWRVGAQYNFTRDIMAYATVSTGYKGPTFYATVNSTPAISTIPVKPETSLSYEAGLKSTLFDRRLVLNLTAFHTTFDDFQTTATDTTQSPPTGRLTNAGELRTRGFEGEFTARVAEGLILSGGVTYLDAIFADFKGASCYPGQPVSTDPRLGCARINGANVTDASGNFLGRQSPWYVNLAAQYRRPIGDDLQLSGSVNYSWRDKFNFSSVEDPNLKHPAYGLVNATLGLEDQDGRWRAGLYARNLFDKFFAASIGGQTFNGVVGAKTHFLLPEHRRTVGVYLEVSY